LAVFSLFMPEQQPFSPSWPHFPAQHAVAVLSFAQLSLLQPSLQQDAAVLSLSFFMQDMASLPPLGFMSFPAQQACASFASVAAILSQHAHFALSAGVVLCCGAAGVVWVEVWAQVATVRARIKANILYRMMELS
jgi:hypothetical protein